MDDPLDDIPRNIQIILGSSQKNSEDQIKEITKYYHEHVEYKSFTSYIPSNGLSRSALIDLNRFHRGFNWNDTSQIHDVWFNEDSLKAVVEVTQTARRGIFFWRKQQNRFMIKLDLCHRNDGKYVIKRQEVLMQPEEFARMMFPLVVPSIITLQKFLLGVIAIVIGRCLELIGCS